MASSSTLEQIKQYVQTSPGASGEIEKQIKKAYQGPVKQLIKQGGKLREQYYPEFFNAAERYGTGGGDLSPAAKLAAMIGDSERMGGRYRQNLGLRDYYGTMINDLVGKAMQGYQMGYGGLKDLYSMEYQREQDAIRNALAGRGSGGGMGAGILEQIMALYGKNKIPNLPGIVDAGKQGVQGGLSSISNYLSPNASYSAGQQTSPYSLSYNQSPYTAAAQGGLNSYYQ